MGRRTRLDESILAAFARACAEDRLDVAEHLLCALETLDPTRNVPGRYLAKAYRAIGARAPDPGSHAHRPAWQRVACA